MWWIAACLGALVWLLFIRIKLKDQQRPARLLDRVKATPLAEGEEAKIRQEFIHRAFVPAAEGYLKAQPQLKSMVLLLARFLDEEGGPDSVHGEVLPCTDAQPQWPAAALDSPVVKREDDELVLAPPPEHWDRLMVLEAWRDALPAFAAHLKPVAPDAPFTEAYTPYAILSRAEDGFQLNVLVPAATP